MVKNGCGQSVHRAQKWTDGIKSVFHAGTNSGKLKFDSIVFGWAWSKIAMAFSWDPNNFCKNEFMNRADFLNAVSEPIIFC